MKTLFFIRYGLNCIILIFIMMVASAQSERMVKRNYLNRIKPYEYKPSTHQYRMTAIYTNRDLYGNFTGRIKIKGDYYLTEDSEQVRWDNVCIFYSQGLSEPFGDGIRQEFMNGFQYVPSPEMLKPEAFSSFPQGIESVFSMNLVWDMMSIELFARNYLDSLELNKTFRINDSQENFEMGDIGQYSQDEIQLCWTGLSSVDNVLCNVIEYRAIDNMLSLDMDGLTSRGTEQYWGTVWVSNRNHEILKADMYSGTIQEISVPGTNTRFITKTIRELFLEKIQ